MKTGPDETERQRVLHIITRFIIGGAQENTMLTCDYLPRDRWAADALSGPQTGPEGSLLDEVRSRGVPLTIEPTLVREVAPLKDLVAFFRLTAAIRRGRYRIVHTHSSKAGILGRWAAWVARTPVIIHTVHGWGHHDHQRPLVRWFYIALEKLTLPITDKLICVTPKDVEKGLRDRIGRPEHYTVIRSGIELDRFGHPTVPRAQVRAALGLPEDAPVVVTVTRLSPQKAPLDFVTAASLVAAERPDVHFLVVGDGPLRPEVEARLTELGLSDKVVLAGLRRDVPELLAAGDVFALSSLWEGLPRVLLQAMATGLPVVATAADGSAEVVEDGVTGYACEPGRPEQLAARLLEVLSDPGRAQRMGEAGRAKVEPFSARQMVDDIAALYEACN